MKLVIVIGTNKRCEVEVDGEDKVKTLKTKICDKCGYPPYMQTLMYSGQQLQDERTFEQEGVLKETTIYTTITQTIGDMIELTVQSKINDSLKTYIRIEEGKKIGDLQQKIFEEFKCRPEKQLLYAIHGRKPEKEIFLHEDKGIWEYEFDHHFVIYVYYDFEGTVLFQHIRSGERYKMRIKSNSLITRIKDQLRNEHNLSVTEIYNEANVRLDDQSTIAATRVTPSDVLFIELLDDARKDGYSTNFPPENYARDQQYQQQQQLPPKYHQQPPHPQPQPQFNNYPPNYPQHNQRPQQQQRDPNQQRYERHREQLIRPQIDPNVTPQARHPDNYRQNPMEPNFPPPRAHVHPPAQYPPPNQYPPQGPPQPLPRGVGPLDRDTRGALRNPDGPPVYQDFSRNQGYQPLEQLYSARNVKVGNINPFPPPKHEDWYGNQGGGYNPTQEEPIYQKRDAVTAPVPSAPLRDEYEMGDRFLSQVICAAEKEWEKIGTILLDDFPRIQEIKRQQNNETFSSSMCVLHEWKQRRQSHGANSRAMPYNSQSLAYALQDVGRMDLVHRFFPRK